MRFEQFEKQNAVCPNNAEFEGDVVDLFAARRAEFEDFPLVKTRKFTFDFGNRFFKQRAAVAPAFGFALNQRFVFLPCFFKPDDMQKFRVKVRVQNIAVFLERLFKQVIRRKKFVERD